MKRLIEEEAGKTSVEWLLVMLLLVLFASAVFVLAGAASSGYEGIVEAGDDSSEVRIAGAYLGTKIKQNDVRGRVRVVERKDLDASALVLEEVLLGETYETWIYLKDGALREATIPVNGKLDDDLSFVIAALDAFDVALSEGALTFHLQKGSLPSRTFYYQLMTE